LITIKWSDFSAYFRKILPGLILCGVLSYLAKTLATFLPVGGISLVILLGLILRNGIPLPAAFNAGICFAEYYLLPFAIILLGFQLELNTLLDLGGGVLLVTILLLVGTIGISYGVGSLLGLPKEFSLLMGCGNAICGSSAIAAIAPLLKNKEQETALAIGVVNLLGSIGIFTYPWLVDWFRYNDLQAGVLLGGTLQSVGQVLGAAFSINIAVGQNATMVKMSRVLLLGPVILVFSLLANHWQGTKSKSGKQGLPWFMVGFFITSILASLKVWPQSVTLLADQSGNVSLYLAMAALGLKINLRTLGTYGFKPLILGGLTVCLQVALALALIALFF